MAKNDQRAKAARIMEKGLVGKMPQKTRTSPGPVVQRNMGAMGAMNDQGNAPAAMPFKKGGAKCYAKGGAHDDEAQDRRLFKQMYKQEEKKEVKLAAGGKVQRLAIGGIGKQRLGMTSKSGKPIAPPKRSRGLM